MHRFIFATAACLCAATGAGAQPAGNRMPALHASLVLLQEIDPSIQQDLRYATTDNFTGAVVPGYEAGVCILTRRTAEALMRVQRDLTSRGLGLKVYDCYRPRRAVAAFVAWATTPAAAAETGPYNPIIPRERLTLEGYIAARSGHARGHAVDLTLVILAKAGNAVAPGGRDISCTTQAAADQIDMGTTFDCFDEKSWTNARNLPTEVQRWRRVLVDAMAKHGFYNYSREWWHFSFAPGDPGRDYDVPVRQTGP